WTGVLDLRTGRLSHANAGHDPPYILPGAGGPLVQLGQASGPPLCFLEEVGYDATATMMQRGDTLCVVTDGVTEAMNASGELYGRARLAAVLSRLGDATSANQVGETVRTDVESFAAGAEPADDMAILVLRWIGPSASGR